MTPSTHAIQICRVYNVAFYVDGSIQRNLQSDMLFPAWLVETVTCNATMDLDHDNIDVLLPAWPADQHVQVKLWYLKPSAATLESGANNVALTRPVSESEAKALLGNATNKSGGAKQHKCIKHCDFEAALTKRGLMNPKGLATDSQRSKMRAKTQGASTWRLRN